MLGTSGLDKWSCAAARLTENESFLDVLSRFVTLSRCRRLSRGRAESGYATLVAFSSGCLIRSICGQVFRMRGRRSARPAESQLLSGTEERFKTVARPEAAELLDQAASGIDDAQRMAGQLDQSANSRAAAAADAFSELLKTTTDR